jgi:glycosyltransferase involved in cell wall biosynthesis
MAHRMMNKRRILMTIDAVGGIWQYAITLAKQLQLSGDSVVLAGCGPRPTPEQSKNAESIGTLVWLQAPPCWMATAESELDGFPAELTSLVREHAIDILHLNETSQAANLTSPSPIVAVSHSCTTTWFRAVRGSQPPASWEWHRKRTRAGLHQADLIVSPSASHSAELIACYGALPPHTVVHNAVTTRAPAKEREDFVFAAARWWDEGKNGRTLDLAASQADWPVVAAGATIAPNEDTISFRHAISLGPIAHNETLELVSRCGVFVSPSIYEPFGLAALEAASAGAPLVLADIPTYRELWSDAAIFFPPDDFRTLVAILKALAGDVRLRRALGEAALSRSRLFTLARQSAAMRAAYDEATALHARRAA